MESANHSTAKLNQTEYKPLVVMCKKGTFLSLGSVKTLAVFPGNRKVQNPSKTKLLLKSEQTFFFEKAEFLNVSP